MHSFHYKKIRWYVSRFSVVLIIWMSACAENQREGTDAAATMSGSPADSVALLTDEVMNIHDEAMLKMGDLMKMKRQIRREIAHLDSLVQSQAGAEKKEELYSLLTSLNKADSSMMQWMRDYEPDLADQSRREKLEYLSHEREKIIDVQNQMETSIQEAETYLSRYQTPENPPTPTP
jgi:asparagine synthetase B (glutamine-hydrolysing)